MPLRSHCRKARSSALPFLEPLEIRALLSAAIQITGNAAPIANHDTTPSTLDFTDFRFASTTIDAALGTISRTFTINNTGDAPLTFTGAGPLALSGPNAADFQIESQPAAAIDVGTSSTFTIDFIPKAAGLRKATLTLKTNDPANPTFTFNIQGTALKTINDSSNHLQYATTHITNGHISSSLAGQSEGLFDYTGALISGPVVFDNTSNLQFSSLELELDNSGAVTGNIISNGSVSGALIQGLTLALGGIKRGETRDILIPSDLAYGSDPNGTYPTGVSPGDPLLFIITARPPTLAVYGSATTAPLRIAAGDTTPSADDGTLFANINTASMINSLDGAFAIANVGNGNLSYNPSIFVTGGGAKSFSSTVIGSSNGFFTLTFHPAAPGTQTAVVHVKSADPLTPDFAFTVSGTSDPFIDLTAAVGAIHFPATVLSGAATKYKIPITFTNSSDQNFPAGFPAVPVQIFLHNTTDESDTLISSPGLTTTAFAGLAARASRTVNFMQSIPITIPAGTYDILVSVNHDFTISENNTSNDSATSSPVAITQGVNALNGTLGASTFPVMIAASSVLSGKLSLTFINTGNLALPAGQKFTIQLVVVNTNSLAQTNLGAAKTVTAALAAGKSFTTSLMATLAKNTLLADTYQIEAIITPVTALAGVANLTLSTNGAAATIPLTIT